MPTLMPGSCSVTGVMVSHRKPPSSDFLRWFLSSVCPLRFPLTTACSHKHVTPWPFCAKSWQLAAEALVSVGGTSSLDGTRRLLMALALCGGGTHHRHRRLSPVAERGRPMPGALPAPSAS